MSAVPKEKQFAKRDLLVSYELQAQERWQREKVFEQDAPLEDEPKYMVAFPYPYMNGFLHLGHAFSVSKPEFAVGYERLKGKRALFPFGFHCTGMPIKAASDKIVREIKMFGKNFENYKVEEEVEIVEETKKLSVEETDPSKKKKHGKAATKNTGLKYQFQILHASGIPLEDIHKFADPTYWIKFFPPLATEDLKRFGAHVDWRRSFVTTDVNPYYDSFIRWQFNKLHEMAPSKIQFGERYTIYSPLDGQACMDHDRSSGEGVGVQEYTGIKLKVLLDDLNKTPLESRPIVKGGWKVGKVLSSAEFSKALGGRTLHMVAATLRPETMYGQTNCYVGVDLKYGVYAVSDSEAWICTERSAKNMSWQGLFKEKGVAVKLFDILGSDLIGVPLKAPLSSFEKVYTLPMEGVLANKGTGVVTSVPSDSPDDYVTMLDLQKKAAYYEVQTEWVTPFLPPKPIISTPLYGNLCAVAAVEQLKIASQKDKEQLAKAKDMVYKEGFYNGTMMVGVHAGKPVQEAKPLIRQLLIDQGLAFPYCEPEGPVVSRSGDECVVASMSQWYMNYGEDSWKAQALDCLGKMELFHEETRNAFLGTLDWLGQWACSRSFGLGSRLPWDKEWLIESLSDSTIYMAYYTVAHILHEGNLDGSSPSKAGIKPEEMTDEVWSYIMLDEPMPKTTISLETLNRMKREFNYFYPLDLRTSGKDLINNHLSFFIYNHVAIFPEAKWPQGIRVNGHLLLNGEKMSKSTGNFLTIRDALEKYGADAIRFALADAGDSLEDANFLEKTADDAILKLYTEREWMHECFVDQAAQLRSGPLLWADRVFNAELDSILSKCDSAYSQMLYRDAIKIGYYELQNARNDYRKSTTGQGLNLKGKNETFVGLHKDLVKKFITYQAIVLAPITPHWSENIWSEILKEKNSIMLARWPKHEKADEILLKSAAYIKQLVSNIRSADDAANKKKLKKNKGKPLDPPSPGELVLYVADVFPQWQEDAIAILKNCFDGKTFKGEREALVAAGLIKDKRVMPFVASIKANVEAVGESAFDRRIAFNEIDVLNENLEFIRRDLFQLNVVSLKIVKSSTVQSDKSESALPGQPSFEIVPKATD